MPLMHGDSSGTCNVSMRWAPSNLFLYLSCEDSTFTNATSTCEAGNEHGWVELTLDLRPDPTVAEPCHWARFEITSEGVGQLSGPVFGESDCACGAGDACGSGCARSVAVDVHDANFGVTPWYAQLTVPWPPWYTDVGEGSTFGIDVVYHDYDATNGSRTVSWSAAGADGSPSSPDQTILAVLRGPSSDLQCPSSYWNCLSAFGMRGQGLCLPPGYDSQGACDR